MQFAFGPKILLDPRCALTFAELKSRFNGKCKISSGASLILWDEVEFNSLDLGTTTFVCETGTKCPGQKIIFEPATEEDSEVYKIRGFKPVRK